MNGRCEVCLNCLKVATDKQTWYTCVSFGLNERTYMNSVYVQVVYSEIICKQCLIGYKNTLCTPS